MSAGALETLRQVNDSLRSALLRLHPERGHCSAIQPQDFSDLRNQILRAGECLRRISANPEAAADLEAAAVEKESLEYRSHLEHLKRFLPDLHARLLAEKARVETAKTPAAAVGAWARASRKTV